MYSLLISFLLCSSASDFIDCGVLKTLSMDNNQLHTFSNVFSISDTLEFVYFGNNQIASFDRSIHMPVVKKILMSNNALDFVDMDEIFRMFPRLTNLNVARNKIKTLKQFNKTMCEGQKWSLVSNFV